MRIDIRKKLDGTAEIVNFATGQVVTDVVSYCLSRGSVQEPEMLTITVRLPTISQRQQASRNITIQE